MKSLGTLAIFAALSTGCATNPQTQAMIDEFWRTVPTCSDQAGNCERKWNAAQVWVAQNSAMKVQIATDAIIETFNPPANSNRIAARVLKEPAGDGQYRLVVSIWCSNIFGCSPNAHSSALAFNRAIAAVQ